MYVVEKKYIYTNLNVLKLKSNRLKSIFNLNLLSFKLKSKNH